MTVYVFNTLLEGDECGTLNGFDKYWNTLWKAEGVQMQKDSIFFFSDRFCYFKPNWSAAYPIEEYFCCNFCYSEWNSLFFNLNWRLFMTHQDKHQDKSLNKTFEMGMC